MFRVVVFAIQPILLNAISVPVMAYIIRQLGPSAFGEWAAANSLVLVLTPLMNMGLRGHYTRSVAAEPSEAPALTAEQFGLRLSLGLIAAAAAVLLAAGLHYPRVAVACTAIAGVGLVLNGVATTATDLFQASGRLQVVAGIAMAAGLALTIASAVAVGAGAGPVGLSIAYLLGPAISAAASAWIIGAGDFPLRVRCNLRRSWEHLRAARFFAAQQLVASLGQNAEALAAPALVGMARYGLFSAGSMIPGRLAAIPDGLATALYPIVAGEHGRDEGGLSREIGGFLTLNLALCLPLCILCMFIADPIAAILFPGEPGLCALVIRITAWSLPAVGIDMILGYSLNAAGREASQARVALLSGVTSFAASLALISRFGLLGACGSYLIRAPIAIAFRLPSYRRTFGSPLAGVPLLRILACCLLLWAGLWSFHSPLWSMAGDPAGPRGVAHWMKVLALLSIEAGASLLAFGVPAALLGVFGELRPDAFVRRFLQARRS